MRALLTLLTLAVFALGAYGMWRGWHRKASHQQHLLPLPAAPDTPGHALLPPAKGLYVGTTVSGDWQARVVAGQLSDRSAATLRLSPEGLLIERNGAPEIFIPRGTVCDARLDSALAGKVMGEGRLFVVTWQHHGELLDTAFRADQHTVHVPYLHAVLDLVRRAPIKPGSDT
jgi:hypothetical protein